MKPKKEDIIKIDDSDGRLHIYVCMANNGTRWAAAIAFNKKEKKLLHFQQQLRHLMRSVEKTLVEENIISGKRLYIRNRVC